MTLKYFQAGVRRSVGIGVVRSIGSGSFIGTTGEDKSGCDWYVGIEVEGEVSTREWSCDDKYVKVGVNLRVDESVGIGVNLVVVA